MSKEDKIVREQEAGSASASMYTSFLLLDTDAQRSAVQAVVRDAVSIVRFSGEAQPGWRRFNAVPKVVSVGGQPSIYRLGNFALPKKNVPLAERMVDLFEAVDDSFDPTAFPVTTDGGIRSLVNVYFGLEHLVDMDVIRWAAANKFALGTNEDLIAVARYLLESGRTLSGPLVQIGTPAAPGGKHLATSLHVESNTKKPTLHVTSGTHTGLSVWNPNVSFLLVDLEP